MTFDFQQERLSLDQLKKEKSKFLYILREISCSLVSGRLVDNTTKFQQYHYNNIDISLKYSLKTASWRSMQTANRKVPADKA